MSDWNFDPYLLLAIGIAAALTWLPARRDKRVGQWLVAIALFTVAFVSPLCALSSALFSARAAHHIVLISLVAPLAWRFECRRSSYSSFTRRCSGYGICPCLTPGLSREAFPTGSWKSRFSCRRRGCGRRCSMLDGLQAALCGLRRNPSADDGARGVPDLCIPPSVQSALPDVAGLWPVAP